MIKYYEERKFLQIEIHKFFKNSIQRSFLLTVIRNLPTSDWISSSTYRKKKNVFILIWIYWLFHKYITFILLKYYHKIKKKVIFKNN